MSSDRRSINRSSDHSFDRSYDNQYDCSQRPGPRSKNTQRRAYGSSPTAAGILPEHQNDFLTKVINAIKIDPQRALTPDCICCLAMNVKPELRKHYFADYQFANNNEFCQTAFKNLCGVLNGLSKKLPVSDDNSKATRNLAIHRLETILGSHDVQLEEDLEEEDIESDDDASTGSNPDFP